MIVELMSHMGTSISLGSVQNMIDSLSSEANERLQKLEDSNTIYDNYDMDFPKAQATMENVKYHWSATAITYLPYRDVEPVCDLRFVEELLLTSEHNIELDADDPGIKHLGFQNIILSRIPPRTLDHQH